MANKAAIAKNKKRMQLITKGKLSRVKYRNRCQICGRPHGYLRLYKLCRICFRLRALNGEIPGVVKSTW